MSISRGMSNRRFSFAPSLERVGLAIALACAALLCLARLRRRRRPPGPTRLVYAPGKIVPIPASIPHEAGDMVDKRILPDLRWIAQRYPIYVTDGYSGPLPNGDHVGCDECHVKGSDHYNGLAVDLVPLDGELANATPLGADHPPRPLGRAGPEQADAALPLGRLRRRRRPRLRQPPPPLLEPRPGGPVPARRMGRSLPGRRRRSTAGVPRTRSLAARRSRPPGPSGGISTVRTGGLGPRGVGD